MGQAADYYFSRDLDTLSRREMLALAVLVRSPSRLDLYRSGEAVAATIRRLAGLMVERGELAPAERDLLLDDEINPRKPELPVSAPHFVSFVKSAIAAGPAPGPWTATTLDAGLQRTVQNLLDRRLAYTGEKRAEHGAVLVVDNRSREVLAWVVGGGGDAAGPRTHIDAVRAPRQPRFGAEAHAVRAGARLRLDGGDGDRRFAPGGRRRPRPATPTRITAGASTGRSACGMRWAIH